MSANTNTIFLAADLLCGSTHCGIKVIKPDRDLIAGPADDPDAIPATEWPWMASLGYYATDGEWSHQCGATLIDPRHFLTAAHCLKEVNKK